jgi:hypothetical protein
VPSRSVRDSGANLHPFQQRRSHEPDSSDPGGPRVWALGSSGWIPGRHIQRGGDRSGRENMQYRCHDVVKFCCMARRTEGKEMALCDKPVEAIQALAQRKRENGDTALIRFRVRTRRKDGVIRNTSGIPTLSDRSADERLVLVQVRRAFLQVLHTSVRMGPEPDVFTQQMVPMVRKLREQYRVLAYLDDFLICPVKAERVASMRDCRKATQVIDKLHSSLGLTRHPTTEEWVESTRVEHLGCVIDSFRMHIYMAPRKIFKVHGFARSILRQARQGRRGVLRDRLRSFCGVCVSLSLGMPFARFCTSSLFDDMTRGPRESRESRNGNRCRLSHQSIKNLQMWRKLASTETDGRPIRPLPTTE